MLGEVVCVDHDRVHVRLQYSIAAGDGIVFEGDRATGSEQGGRVYQVYRHGVMQTEAVEEGVVELDFDSSAVDAGQLRPGLRLWKTDDPKLNRQLRRTFDTADPQRKVDLHLHVEAVVGRARR